MTKKEFIDTEITAAMKRSDKRTLNVLRQIKTALSNFAVANGRISDHVGDSDVIAIIRKELKKRQDFLDQYANVDRPELIAVEKEEVKILLGYLPPPTTLQDIQIAAASTIALGDNLTKKDMSMVITKLYEHFGGAADRKEIASVVGPMLPAPEKKR